MTTVPEEVEPGASAEVEEHKGRVIVAIPTATEPVHHLGDVSEPKHMTLVYLGKPDENPNLDMDQVRGQVEAVAERSGPLTGLVESTGPLGDDGAVVWFLRGDGIEELRNDLLSQSYIRDGFGAVEQFPTFTPHVTAGYEMEPEDVPTEETSPEEIIFDRISVWDGDEHTEYPLGPSASSTVPEGTDEFEKELMAAMTEPIHDLPMEGDGLLICSFGSTPKLAVNDAESLAAACEKADKIPDEMPRVFTRRLLAKRARELGCQHVIPKHWLRQPTPTQTSNAAAPLAADPPKNLSDAFLFQVKTQESGLSDTALRAAYMRGVRSFTMTAPQSRPPLPRDVVAQARVNSLIRLAQGDLSARTEDRDLLP